MQSSGLEITNRVFQYLFPNRQPQPDKPGQIMAFPQFLEANRHPINKPHHNFPPVSASFAEQALYLVS